MILNCRRPNARAAKFFFLSARSRVVHAGKCPGSHMVAARRSYAISTHGRWRQAKSGQIRRVRAKKDRYAELGIMGLATGRKQNNAQFHALQAAAFPQVCDRLTAERDTWDHKSNDRDDPKYMHAANLRPASRSEQALNKTTSDNWIEGRPQGEGDWVRFRNPGRAAATLREREPGKNWDDANIHCVLKGRNKQHQGWEFRYVDASTAVRMAAPETPRRAGEAWRALVMPGGEDAPQCEVSDRGRYQNSRGRVYTPRAAHGHRYAEIGVDGRQYKFHNCVAATFADVVGAKPGDGYTIDHRDTDAANNRAENLRWASKSEQMLNQTTSDNWIEGRPQGEGSWVRFRNSGRAVATLREREPGKNWSHGSIGQVLEGRRGCKQHLGWEFRYVDASTAVRKVCSAATEAQWRDDPDHADEQWARLEPLGAWRLRVIPERRDGTEGGSFVVDLREFRGPPSESERDDRPFF